MPDPRYVHCPDCAGGSVNCPTCHGEDLVTVQSVYPEGHGLHFRSSAVCWCGRLVLECPAMVAWAARRRDDAAIAAHDEAELMIYRALSGDPTLGEPA